MNMFIAITDHFTPSFTVTLGHVHPGHKDVEFKEATRFNRFQQ